MIPSHHPVISLWSTVGDTELCPPGGKVAGHLWARSADTSGCQPSQGLPLPRRPRPPWGCTEPVTGWQGSTPIPSWPWLCGSSMEDLTSSSACPACLLGCLLLSQVVLVSKLRGFKWHKFILSQLWKLKAPNQGVVSRTLLPEALDRILPFPFQLSF